MIRALWAFPLKEWRLYRNYRFAMALNITSILGGVFTFYYVGRLFDGGQIPELESFQGYFPFVIVGIAASNFLISTLNGLATTLRREQDVGTLEAVLVAPIPDFIAILGLVLWNVILSLFIGLGYLAVGSLVTSFTLNWVSTLSTLVILTLSALTFLSLGVMAASFILLFKRGNPIAWVFSSLSILLGGVYFPIHLLPPWLAGFSQYLPLTLSIHGLRQTLIQGASLSDVWLEVQFLLVFSVCFAPLSILFLRYALKKCRRVGGLSHQ